MGLQPEVGKEQRFAGPLATNKESRRIYSVGKASDRRASIAKSAGLDS
jgi:hypothetical protein